MPVFLPTTLQGAEEIIESINELKNNVTSDLQPVTEKLNEDQKEGTVVQLRFPSVVEKTNDFSFSARDVINLTETSECLFFPTQ